MGLKVVLLLAMVALPIALFVWARRRRGPSMDNATASAGFQAVRAGAPLTKELIEAVAVYTARNAYKTEGVVVAVFNQDHYGVRLSDGTQVRGSRSKAMWQRGIVFAGGDRVALLAVKGSDLATIRGRL